MFSLKTLSHRMPSVASLALIGAIGIGVSACSEEKAEVKQVIRPVKVVEIAKAGDTRKLDYSGSVKTRTEMNLGFRVAGKITERLVDIGDKVKPGDVLARMDSTDYQLAVKTAEANLAAAEKRRRNRRSREQAQSAAVRQECFAEIPARASVAQLRSGRFKPRCRRLGARSGEEPGELCGAEGRP